MSGPDIEASVERYYRTWRERVPGFGDDEQICAYCEDKPGTHDPALGYACGECKRSITHGTENE